MNSKVQIMNAPKSITLNTIVITFTSTVNGFYHKNIPQNEALKNKKNDCGHRNQKRNFPMNSQR
jgi:hypothetical protein|uniref:Uncharacterized protein n=1 Tax=Bacillus pumilus TaxID=1408 RepID=A0A385EK70_BACPU|nr:hypothetical protein [Bacillus pumilus]AXQ85650.1 hypothetical protein [Bacillus pumilus]AXQ85660.1 hypothetical protein [Bacillus pumilus]AYF52474.1 hypothetical protein [Bacillus pumilus]